MTDDPLFSVRGKVALVTGGSRGIGFMIARGFVQRGVRTYVSSRRVEACQATVAELSAVGEACALPADVSTMEGISGLARQLAERERVLHILVNNAGTAWGSTLEGFPEGGWDKVLALNAKAPFFLTRELLPLLRAAATVDDPARVINIGSVDGLHVPRFPEPFANYSYSASKAALHHLTRTLAKRLAPEQITVNAVAPGPFPSKMTEVLFEQFRAQIEAGVPRGRVGSPEDMAGVAIYLASRAGAYVTGVVIPVDGGLVGAL